MKINLNEEKNDILSNDSQKIIKKINKRNYGIDLSRIISIILIINHHIIFHGGPLGKIKKFSFHHEIIVCFNVICCSGVNIFGIISGCIGFKSHKYSNLFYLLFVTFFYNIFIALIFKFFSHKLIDINYFLYPLFISDYWYFNSYFLMYFFLPVINKGINQIDENSMLYYIINLFLIFSCLGEIKNYNKRLQPKDILYLRRGFSYFWLLFILF